MDAADRVAWLALRTVIDPELGLDIVTLGLVYSVEVAGEAIRVRMTLTSRGCPLGDSLVALAQEALNGVAGSRRVDLRLVWEPPWSPEKITPEGRTALRGG